MTVKPLHILFVVGEFPALSETFILNQISGLSKKGHHVDVYALKSRESLPQVAEQSNNRLPENIFYSNTPNSFTKRISSFPALLCKYGIRRVSTIAKSLNVFSFGRASASLKLPYDALPMLHQPSYDIIHCHFGINGNLAVKLRKLGLIKGKIVTTFHGYDITMVVKKYGPGYYKELFENGDFFLPVSSYWKDTLINMGCDKSRICVHKMGVDCTKFDFSVRNIANDSKIRIISIARLVEKKGIAYGIRAISQLLDKLPNLEYIIVGDGPLKNDLQALVSNLGADKHIKLTGWQPQNKIVEMLRTAHIFMAPSITAANGDQEGIPVVIMEAMAMGLPVISTNHSGISELVQDGVSGFLSEEGNIKQLANALTKLIQTQDLSSEMGRMGRYVIESMYNIDVLNNRLVKIFDDLSRN